MRLQHFLIMLLELDVDKEVQITTNGQFVNGVLVLYGDNGEITGIDVVAGKERRKGVRDGSRGKVTGSTGKVRKQHQRVGKTTG